MVATAAAVVAAKKISNRGKIMQSIVFNDCIGKRISSLEQMRKGLRLFGVLDIVANNEELFESLFVYKDSQLTMDLLMQQVTFEIEGEEDEKIKNVKEKFTKYLEKADRKKLEEFLLYCTGSKLLPLQKIRVKFAEGDGIVGSTCLMELTLPLALDDNFAVAFDCLLNTSVFSTV